MIADMKHSRPESVATQVAIDAIVRWTEATETNGDIIWAAPAKRYAMINVFDVEFSNGKKATYYLVAGKPQLQ
jgi:hypothetical protein